MTRPIITVIGGTGRQGGSVVDALLAGGDHAVRVPTRNPDSAAARALAARGVEVVAGDLVDPASLRPAFTGAHGAFVVTNFLDPTQHAAETAIGRATVEAARAAGVAHLIWSTLPDVAAITGGRIEVAHFTDKARVDDVVRRAGFARHTFVEAPFYFQNFQTMLAPQPLPGGGRGWAVPMDPTRRVIHAGDVADVGRAVAAAFADVHLADGSRLAVCGGLYAWTDFAATPERPRPSGRGGAGPARALRRLLPRRRRAARDVPVLRGAHLLRAGCRGLDRRRPRAGARRIPVLRRLGPIPPGRVTVTRLTRFLS